MAILTDISFPIRSVYGEIGVPKKLISPKIVTLKTSLKNINNK